MESDNKIRVFADATAIVTGAASGIGRGLAEELSKRGCEVVLADLQIESTEKIANTINTGGGKATAAKINVTDYQALAQLVHETINRTGRIDYFFNNAGIGVFGTVDLHDVEDWNYIIDVNLRGVTNGIQAVYKHMISQGFGQIINTASVAGLIPTPGLAAYAATKHAVVGLSTSLRTEAAKFGIGVNVICPGFVRTAILDDCKGKYGKLLPAFSSEQLNRCLKLAENFKPMDPNIFAEKVLNSVAKNKAIIIIPSWAKLIWLFHRLFPTTGINLTQFFFKKILKHIFP